MHRAAAASDASFADGANISRLRKDLLRFAVLQLRNRELAEDVVQEAMMAAYASRDRFEHRSAFKTWVFRILKNKIVDALRDRWYKNRVEMVVMDEGDDFDVLFNSSERWHEQELPSPWGNPEQSFEDQQFWLVLELCMTRLPEATARVFSMREFLGLDVDAICKELAIKPCNCWVILHRARMHLRLCLQTRWFDRDETT